MFANCLDPDHYKIIEPDQYENITTEDVDVIDLSHIIHANRLDPDQNANCWDSDHK